MNESMQTMRKIILQGAVTALAALMLTGCYRLSSEAKKMVGNYFIPEVSEEQPLMELRKNGRCTIRKVVPGVVTFSVDGRWNVRNDSLVAELKPETLDVEGDSALVGKVPERMAFHISQFNDVSLTLEHDGVNYTYHRRPSE